LRGWNLNIKGTMLSISARMLPTPDLLFSKEGKEMSVRTREGTNDKPLPATTSTSQKQN